MWVRSQWPAATEGHGVCIWGSAWEGGAAALYLSRLSAGSRFSSMNPVPSMSGSSGSGAAEPVGYITRVQSFSACHRLHRYGHTVPVPGNQRHTVAAFRPRPARLVRSFDAGETSGVAFKCPQTCSKRENVDQKMYLFILDFPLKTSQSKVLL